jgi:hypothetical protein
VLLYLPGSALGLGALILVRRRIVERRSRQSGAKGRSNRGEA